MWKIQNGQAASAPHSVPLKAPHSSSAGSLGDWQGQGCLSVWVFNTDAQINSVSELGVGVTWQTSDSRSRVPPGRPRPLGREVPELFLCCRAVSPGWLSGEQRAYEKEILLQRRQAAPLPSLSSPHNCLSSSQRPCP